MDRRNFIKTVWILTLGNLTPKVFAQEIEETSQEVGRIFQQEALNIYKRSLEIIGENEMNYFLYHFSVDDPEVNPIGFVERVKETQTTIWLTWKHVDGSLWPNTLRKIYLENYVYFEHDLPLEIRKRLEVYRALEGYKKKPWALYGKLNVFSNKLYYGRDLGENLRGSYINERIAGNIPETLGEHAPANLIKIFHLGRKIALAFYIDSTLHVATFVSPWLPNHQTISTYTTGSLAPDLLHTSSKYPEASRDSDEDDGWAVMPFAVHINDGFWMHGTDGRVDGTPASHGCVRVPLFYIQEIHYQVQRLWVKNVKIDTRGIY